MRSRRRRSIGALATLALLVLLTPSALSGQVRPEVGLSGSFVTDLSGPALKSHDGDTGVGIDIGVTVAETWRLAVSHRSNTLPSDASLVPDADLDATTVEVRAQPGPLGPLRPYAGWQVGEASVDYDTSIFAAVDFVPGTEIVQEDEGLVHGPTAGIRVPVGRHIAVDVGVDYRWLDVDPAVIGPTDPRDPGRSGGMALTVTLVGRL